MFNIFQYEKINETRLKQEKFEEKSEKAKHVHEKKKEALSSLSNMRRLEWAEKFLTSDVKNSNFQTVLQEPSMKPLNASLFESHKETNSEDEDVEVQSLKSQIRNMDTKVLRADPSSFLTPIEEYQRRNQKLTLSPEPIRKPFNPYSRSYKKNESAWPYLQGLYISSPYQPASQSVRNLTTRKTFKLGVKADLWDTLIKPRGSIQALQSNKSFNSLPDSKLYKKSLEHLITKKVQF